MHWGCVCSRVYVTVCGLGHMWSWWASSVLLTGSNCGCWSCGRWAWQQSTAFLSTDAAPIGENLQGFRFYITAGISAGQVRQRMCKREERQKVLFHWPEGLQRAALWHDVSHSVGRVRVSLPKLRLNPFKAPFKFESQPDYFSSSFTETWYEDTMVFYYSMCYWYTSTSIVNYSFVDATDVNFLHFLLQTFELWTAVLSGRSLWTFTPFHFSSS